MGSEARKGAIYNYLNLLLIIVTGAVLTPYVIRSLGASQYGLYTLMGGILPYMTLLDLGLSRTITRFVSYYRVHNDEEGQAQFMTTAAHIYGAVVLLLLSIGAIIYYHVDAIWGQHFTASELNDVRQMLLIIILAQAIIVPGNAFTSICYGCGYFAFPRAVQPIKYIVRTICIVALLMCGYKAVALIALEAVLNVLIVISTYVYVRKRAKQWCRFSDKHGDYKQVLTYGMWIALYATTCALQWNVAQIIAGITTDAATVGVVGIGIVLGNMYGYFAETINRMTMPRASIFVKKNPTGREVTAEMTRVGRVVAIIQVGVLGAFIIMGRAFVELWAGNMYGDSFYYALIMMSAWTIQQSQEYGNALLEAKGCVRVMSIINFICIFAAAILSYFASLKYGVMYIMGTLAVGTLLVTIINNVYYRYRLQLDVVSYFKGVYARIAVVLMVIVAVSIGLNRYIEGVYSWLGLTITAVVYVIMYAFATYLFVLTSSEREYLKDHVQRKRQ